MRKLCAILCVLAISSAVLAADATAPTANFQSGDKEISGNISIMKSSGGDFETTLWMMLGSFGYFTSPNVQLKGSCMIFGNKADDFTMIDGSLGFGADYLFEARMDLVPYAGGDILMSYSKIDVGGLGDETDTGIGWDIHAGIKQFIADSTALNYEIRYMSDSASHSKWLMFIIGFNVYLQ